MRSERLRWLVKAEGPFASVYLDDSHDTVEAVEQLEAKWRDIRKHLKDQGAGAEIIGKLEEAVLHHRPAVGRRGRAVIATSDQVLLNEQLISPPPATVIRLSDYPYVVPLIDQEMRRPTYVFAAVDHTGADVTLYQGGTVSSKSIDGGGYPVHKPVTAGWNGYGDFQRTTEEAIRMNCRAVADHLTRLVDEADPEVVFLCGEVSSRADLVAELPERVTQRVSELHAGARKSRIDEEEIRELTSAEFARRRGIEMNDIADRFEAEIGRGSGLAAEGLAAVCAALRDGDVDTLIVGELGDATVVTGKALTTIAPDPDVLSELGEPVERVARADEALPFTAIAVDASLVRADNRIASADGVGALLRYVATDRLSSRQS
ncbi:MAG TPA: Vms1/Ankzf1 family peptidyl-tRNA hydrolase [Mycobacterium sp.]|nr:Vms1/Ankzf1 family peptidyl-tRNA hydrolase [Mycobacterium sp.]HUH70955.1 Vms1/Ankzf1 family peptidyl-tRNA hydrolase [Mycobacterium sp.]